VLHFLKSNILLERFNYLLRTSSGKTLGDPWLY